MSLKVIPGEQYICRGGPFQNVYTENVQMKSVSRFIGTRLIDSFERVLKPITEIMELDRGHLFIYRKIGIRQSESLTARIQNHLILIGVKS